MTTPRRFQTLLFDILGSLLDEDTAMARVAERVVGADEAHAFVNGWNEIHRGASADIREGRRGYVPSEMLHAEAIGAMARAHGVPVSQERAQQLSWFGRRLAPFEDVPGALESLAGQYRLIGLTNAGLTQAFEMSGFARLRWTSLISGEQVQTFKPDPRMYEYARTKLTLQPESCLFVAAHPWDLDAAAKHGFRTAYIDRATSTPAEMEDLKRRFDYAEPDLGALSKILGA